MLENVQSYVGVFTDSATAALSDSSSMSFRISPFILSRSPFFQPILKIPSEEDVKGIDVK